MNPSARHLKRTVLHTALGLALGTALPMGAAQAAIDPAATLSIDLGGVVLGNPTCTHTTTTTGGTCFSTALTPSSLSGSYFFMGAGAFGVTLIEDFDGIKLGTLQSAGTASHPGLCAGGETGAITAGWDFFNNCGHEFSTGTGINTSAATSDPNSLSASGTQTLGLPHPNNDGDHFLDFSNWRVTWSGIPTINMGGGLQDCGTSTDAICGAGGTDFSIGGTFFNGSSLAHVACFFDSAHNLPLLGCTSASYYVAEYAAIVPQADPSNFGGVLYEVRLSGQIITPSTTTTTGAPTTTTTGAPTTTTTAAATTTTTAAVTTTTIGGGGTTTTAAVTTTTTGAPVTTTTGSGTTTTGAATTTTTGSGTTTTGAATTTTTAAPVTTTTTTTAAVTTTTTTLPPPDPNAASIITLVQNGQTRSELVIGDGDTTVTSNSPSSTCDWSNTDNQIALLDPLANPTVIPGASLQETSAATLRVACSPEGEKIIRIVSVAGLGGSEDANNNGLGDGLEPAGLAGNQIPVDGSDPSSGLVESSPGTQLEMGTTAFEADNPGVGVSPSDIANGSGSSGGIGIDNMVSSSCVGGCFSLKVSGISPVGSSVRITLPLSAPIPAGAVYRKFFPGFGWLDFDTSQGDTTESADKVGGVCPSPGSATYTSGLTAGDNCVQLKIKDGGPNDTDGAIDGVVTDPGGVANPDTTAPVITLNPPNPETVRFSRTDTYQDPGFTATDDVDGNITNQVVVTGSIDLSTPVSQVGEQTLQYDVSDAAGNPAQTVTRVVTVTTNAGGGDSKNRLGCAVSPLPVSPAARGDWWLLGGFLAWLGTIVRRRRRLG